MQIGIASKHKVFQGRRKDDFEVGNEANSVNTIVTSQPTLKNKMIELAKNKKNIHRQKRPELLKSLNVLLS
jgi:hypothetical protein